MSFWEYPTNFSNGSSVGGIGDFLFTYPKYILGSNFATGILLLIWVSMFSLMLVAKTSRALAVSSFITFFFSVFFWMRGDVSAFVPIILVVLTIIGAVGAKGEQQL